MPLTFRLTLKLQFRLNIFFYYIVFRKTSDDSGINLDETSASSINNTSVVNISTSETNRKVSFSYPSV